MNTLLLDQTEWDLCLDADGNIAMASDPYSISQDVCSAVRLFLGELWYDTTQGVPYFQSILGKLPPVQLIKAQFAAAALTVPQVLSATCYFSSFTKRVLSGQIQFTYSTVNATTGETETASDLITFVGQANGLIAFVGNLSGFVLFESDL